MGEAQHTELAEKVLYERAAQRRVARTMVAAWAQAMTTEMSLNVSICGAWVDRFLSRAGFVLRKAIRKPVLHDDEIIARGVHFVREVRAVIEQPNTQPAMIYNLDETAVFLVHALSLTLDV